MRRLGMTSAEIALPSALPRQPIGAGDDRRTASSTGPDLRRTGQEFDVLRSRSAELGDEFLHTLSAFATTFGEIFLNELLRGGFGIPNNHYLSDNGREQRS